MEALKLGLKDDIIIILLLKLLTSYVMYVLKYLIQKIALNCCLDLKFGELIVMMILKAYMYMRANV